MHIYIKIEGVDSRQLLYECYKEGIIFMPGDVFSVDDSCKECLRLGLSRLSLEEIEQGIKTIGKVRGNLKNN